jgi:TonB family protein
MLEYLFLVTLYWTAFYALYALALRRTTFFGLNRGYLLLSLAAGLALPLVKDLALWPAPEDAPVLYMAPIAEGFQMIQAFEITVTAPPQEAVFPWRTVLSTLYLVGAGFAFFRFSLGLYRLWRLDRSGENARIHGMRTVFTHKTHLPFSFGRTIYLSRKNQWPPEEEADILRHERAHIQDGHTADVLLLELLGVVFWFSPPLYFYRRALRLVHEYIADAAVLRTRAKSVYGRLLIRQAVPGLHLSLAHSFHSSLKQRIAMMTKTQSNPAAKWLYAAFVPLALGLLLAFSNRSAIAASFPELSTLLVPPGIEEKSAAAPTGTATVEAPVLSGGDPDEMPVFAGCENESAEARKACSDQKMLEFVYNRLRYPEKAREAGIVGTVVARFTVSATGEVTGLESLKDIGGGCGEEVLRVLHEMPRWTPGTKEGKPVAVTLTLPVRFALPAEESFTSDYNMVFDSERKELKTSVDGVVNILGVEAKEVTLSDGEQQDSKPIFYVNGKRVSESAVNVDLNPDQIKSIEVLKDEKAIAYAGEEGKNGVILITLYADGEKRPATSGASSGKEAFKVVEEMPRFPGCEDAADLSMEARRNCADKNMLEFVYNNIRYPAQAREAGVEGTVVVSFVIETDGTITEPKVLRDIGGGCGDEVLRVVNLMPRWIPGKQKGQPVRTQFNLPIRYKLEGDVKPSTAPAGTPALKLDDFKLFPNPSTDGKFTLQFNAPAQPTLIQVRDMQGREVLKRNLSRFSGVPRRTQPRQIAQRRLCSSDLAGGVDLFYQLCETVRR